jgi:hypothetical protein
MRRQVKKKKKFEKNVITQMDQRMKEELRSKMRTFRENLS